MKLTPYSKLLTMTKEAIDKSIAPVKARAAKKQAELEVLKLEEKVATLENEITEMCSKRELNFNGIIDKMDDLALAQRRKEQFEKVIVELFPDILN